MRRLISFVLTIIAGSALAADRFYVDFGVPLEPSPAIDAFGRHWNNFSDRAAAVPITALVDSAGAAHEGVGVTITNGFAAHSTNNKGGETIYIPTATSDFWYVTKVSDAHGTIQIEGLDPSGETVYDFRFFVSSNRPSTQVFLTEYTVTGVATEVASLDAIGNVENIARVMSMVPDAAGRITIDVKPASNSTEFGAISVLDMAARPAGSALSEDPAPTDYSLLGTTPNPPATPSPENPHGLRAYVFETVDSFSNRAGLGELLRRAGFHVESLPLDRPPYDPASHPSQDVDLIAFGSFASDSPKYQAYMAAYADMLDDYIDRAGLLVQFSQADQTELTPPFLPDTQDGSRSDTDFDEALILSEDHPLLAGVPRTASGDAIQFTIWDAQSGNYKNTIWEAFQTFFGFEVILSGDPQARYPGLMEGAYGQGRFFVSALAVDKIIDPVSGLETATDSLKAFNQPFFANLYAYTKAVRDLTTPAIKITPQPGESEVRDGSWSIVLLPDTQIYSQNYPGLFEAQTSWIANNLRPRNIRYVFHLGDIVNVNSIPEWRNARRAMKTLDGVVPYALVPGNHDYGPGGNAATRDTFLNDYFHEEDYRAWPTFGGAMEPGKMDNTYHLFRAGGVDWIVMCLEWGPRDSTIAWADGILSQHPNRKAILVTHAYMNNNDYRYDISDTTRPQDYNPHRYTTPGGVNDGEELWQKLVKKHNFVMTVNGHVLGDGTGYRVDNNDAGNPVHQMLSNYQFRTLGGEGYLRVLEFQPDGNTVKVSSYSPIYDNRLLAPDQDFSFQLDLGAADSDQDGILDYYDADFDDDGDGLNNYQEYVVLGTQERSVDSDGDGVSDLIESQLGTNPNRSDRTALDAFTQRRADFGLFTRQDLVDLRPDDVLIDVQQGEVRLQLQLEESTDLQQWTTSGEAIEWTIPAVGNRRLYRFRIDAAE